DTSLADAQGTLDDAKLPDYAQNRGFFDQGGALVNYFSIYQTAQNIWRKIGKISNVYGPQQTLDTRFLDGASEWFAGATTSTKPEFEFKGPPKSQAAPI